ncbi:MAG: hypothetical protein M1835_001608 [Candelina submexicana]|nr:MAG: hypothetical protein M1835_001608 [Candelina submexicana]
MASKRKRQSESSTSRSKRARYDNGAGISSTSAPQNDVPSADEELWKVKDIIEETRTQYLIDWESDPQTGRSYEPTWEPKGNANREAVKYWVKKKRERAAQSAVEGRPRSGRPSKGSTRSTRGTPVKPRRQSRRAKLIITDSSTATSNPESSGKPGQPSEERNFVEHPESQPVSAEIEGPGLSKGKQAAQRSASQQSEAVEIEDSFEQDQKTFAPRKTPVVELSQFTDSKRQQYEFFARLSSPNQAAVSQPEPLINILRSSQDYQRTEVSPAKPGTEVVIPDSQSFPGSPNFAFSSSKPELEHQDHQTDSSPYSEADKKINESTGNQSFRPSNESSANLSHPSNVTIDQVESQRVTSYPADNYWLTAVTRTYTSAGPQSAAVVGPPEKSTREGHAIESSRFQPSAEGLSAIPIARPTSEPPSYEDSQRSAAETIDPELTFQTQVPLVVASNSTQDHNNSEGDLQSTQSLSVNRGNRTSQSTGEIWQSGQGAIGPEQVASQISTDSGHPSHSVASQNQAGESQGSNSTRTSVLSHKDPNPIRQPVQAQDDPQFDIQLPDLKQTLQPESHTNCENTIPSIEGGNEISSSLLPPPPSQLPDTLQHDVTFQSQELLEDAMSTGTQSVASMPSSSLRDRLREMRAASASRRVGATGSARSTRSPSAFTEQAPRHEPERSESSSVVSANSIHLESQTLRDAQLPLRISQDSYLPDKPSHLTLHKETSQVASSVTALGVPRLGKMEFIVPLPINGRVRDQYLQTVFNYRDAIEAFTGSEDHDPELVKQVSEMVERVNKVTTHTDLDNPGTLTQQGAALEDEAKWAENNSAKFLFLRHLLDATRSQDKHIAVLANPGQILDIIETFLKANRIIYARPDKLTRSDTTARGPMNVTLLPTGEAGASFIVNNASLLVAFDSSFSAEERHVQALRAHIVNVGQLSPVVSLVVTNSGEHVDRCLSASLEGPQRLRMLVSCIAQTRHEIGELPLGALSPDVAATEVAAYIALETPLEEYWRVPPIGEITGVTIFSESHPIDSSTQSAIRDSMDTRADGAPTMSKRALEDDDDDVETTKKAKLIFVPQSVIVAQPGSDDPANAIGRTQEINHTTTQGGAPSAQLNDPTQSLGGQHGRVDIKVYQELIERHQAEKERIETRLQEHVDALTDLQFRFEDQSKEMVAIRGERDDAIIATAATSRRLEKITADTAKLKEGRDNLEAELVDARAALLNSTPEIAELEKARAELRRAVVDRTKLENRVQSMTKELEFTRTQYQTASTAAAEASMEVVTLREKNAVLERKANGETVKLRQINSSKDIEMHLARIRELEQILESREDLLKRKDEELKAQTRQRGLGTRASSVPRSPMPHSRASSPASAFVSTSMGRGGHPLRYG